MSEWRCAECRYVWCGPDDRARETHREHMMTAHPTYAAAALMQETVERLIAALAERHGCDTA